MGKKQNLARLLESKKKNVGNHAFSEIRASKYRTTYDIFFPNLSSIVSKKKHGHIQFSFWILIPRAKIFFST